MKSVLALFILVLTFAMGGTAAAASICPDNFAAFAGMSTPLACECSPRRRPNGSVYGMDIYTSDSSICPARPCIAGVIGKRGGPVSVVPQPGRLLMRA